MTLNGVMTADPRYLCGSWASCKFFRTMGLYSISCYHSLKGVRRIFDWRGHPVARSKAPDSKRRMTMVITKME